MMSAALMSVRKTCQYVFQDPDFTISEWINPNTTGNRKNSVFSTI